MKIVNEGNGIHKREIPGLQYLTENLPAEWIGYTNLDLSLPQGAREIDLVLFAEDRIFLIDFKDGHGRYESVDGHWQLNGVPQSGQSPVKKILDNAREVHIKLDRFLTERAKQTGHKRQLTPKVIGVVLLTGSQDLSGIAPTEELSVLTAKDFCRVVKNVSLRIGRFLPVASDFVTNPIYSETWMRHLKLFMNLRDGIFRPGSRKYGGYVATGAGAANFIGPSRIYQEFSVEDNTQAKGLGLLRLWDFSKAETRFQTQEGRLEIAGRERNIIGWLNDRIEDCERAILQPKAEDPDRSPGYWEVYSQARRMKRLSEFVHSELPRVRPADRIAIARQLIFQVSRLHSYSASHMNLGDHSVWIALPAEVRLSHLMAAKYPLAKSLGESRYQFLSSVESPDQSLDQEASGAHQDVFHLGCLVHLILFGVSPAGDPPDWNPGVDEQGTYAQLHHVLAHSISWDLSSRYNSASEMLEAFNSATEPAETGTQVLQRLEAFRTMQSQLVLGMQYPPHSIVSDTDTKTTWRSKTIDGELLVKLWKRAAWSDGSTDLPRILDFLERGRHFSITHPPGCVPIQTVIWLNDAFVFVQPFVDAPNLSEHKLYTDRERVSPEQTLKFTLSLTQTVIRLHTAGVNHGDLKPANILVKGEEFEPLLIDYLDFCCSADGQLKNGAYAPLVGGTEERDRYAVTKMVEELLEGIALPESTNKDISEAIAKCRGEDAELQNIANATLLPLQDALLRAINPPPLQKARKLHIGLPDGPTGALVPDEEGFGYGMLSHEFFIRGLVDVLYFKVRAGRITFARHVAAPQIVHRRLAASQAGVFSAEISIRGNVAPNYADFQLLIEEPIFAGLISPVQQTAEQATSTAESDLEEVDPSELIATTNAETDEDAVEELVEKSKGVQRSSVPELWRTMVDVEASLTNEARAVGPSTIRRESGVTLHAVPIELLRGHFAFERSDKVTVERLGNDGRWRRIGVLDLAKSSDEFIYIEANSWFEAVGSLVDQDQFLRFTSAMEYANISRRDAAVKRILTRRSIVPNLIDYFDPACNPDIQTQSISVDPDEIMRIYGLNNTQARAFAEIMKVRPLSLLQGPPGTGKTKFIGALIHFALTKGYVRNVLLASQSHEAVNNAAEAVLKLFPETEKAPSILRIGKEDDVSESLLPYHVMRVEQLYKDNFHASLKPKLLTAAAAIGLSEDTAVAVVWVENSVRPIVERLNQLAEDQEAEGVAERLASQLDTLVALLISMDLDVDIPTPNQLPDLDLLNNIYDAIADRTRSSPDGIAKLRSVSALSRDIISSVSTAGRTFETFLAGTRQIVAGTCVGLGRSSLGLTSTAFDLVVIDEAARCSASELAVPMQAGRWCVLVGDQKQLEPRVDEKIVSLVADKTGYSAADIVESSFQTVFESHLGSRISQRLLVQYRSLPPIGRVVSNSFYDQALQPGRLVSDIADDVYPPTIADPLTWISTDSMRYEGHQRHEQKPGSKSLVNRAECDLIAGLLLEWDRHPEFIEWIETKNEQEPAIGIICSYAAQAAALRHKLQLLKLSPALRGQLKIGTVDSYQGKQNRIVILSLVRSNSEGPRVSGKPTIRPGFMARPNRINVAASRAMDRLVIVGAKDGWAPDGPMGMLRQNFDKEVQDGHGAVLDALVLLDAQRANDASDTRKRSTQPHKKEVP